MSTDRLELDLAEALHRQVDDVALNTGLALAELPRRVSRRRRKRVSVALSLALVAAAAGYVVQPGDRRADGPPLDPPKRVALVEPRGTEPVALGSRPSRVSLRGTILWATLDTGVLARVDTTTGNVTRVGELPSVPFEAEPADRWVWVSLPNDNRVVALDPRDGRIVHSVATTAPGPRGMVLAGDSLWSTAGTELLEVDATTGRRLRTVAMPDAVLPYDLAVSADSVWVTDSRSRAVTRYRLDDGGLTRIDVGGPTVGVVVAAGTVWVGLKEEGRLLRLDAATGKVRLGPVLPSAPLGLAAIGDEVWATAPDDDQVLAFDAATGRPTLAWRVGNFPPVVAGDGDDIWVSSHLSGEVIRVPEQAP